MIDYGKGYNSLETDLHRPLPGGRFSFFKGPGLETVVFAPDPITGEYNVVEIIPAETPTEGSS